MKTNPSIRTLLILAILSLTFTSGCDEESSTAEVITLDVWGITPSTANSGGAIKHDGKETVTARGICWSTSPSPTVNDSKTVDGAGKGSFSSGISGLSAATTYYVRAYATNSIGTAYGQEEQFSTAP